jgi:hypothetical protein
MLIFFHVWQLEGWLSLGPIARSQSDQSRTEGNAVLDSTLILKQRLQSLQVNFRASKTLPAFPPLFFAWIALTVDVLTTIK